MKSTVVVSELRSVCGETHIFATFSLVSHLVTSIFYLSVAAFLSSWSSAGAQPPGATRRLPKSWSFERLKNTNFITFFYYQFYAKEHISDPSLRSSNKTPNIFFKISCTHVRRTGSGYFSGRTKPGRQP